jgi:hypothetical protein
MQFGSIDLYREMQKNRSKRSQYLAFAGFPMSAAHHAVVRCCVRWRYKQQCTNSTIAGQPLIDAKKNGTFLHRTI